MPKAQQKHPLTVAYFTMEIALDAKFPTFAGGLGVLAADIIRSCADLKVPAVCMTVCWQHGYLHQNLAKDGTQSYEDISWIPEQFMKKLPQIVHVMMEGHNVAIGAWEYRIQSNGHTVPVLFLDTNLPENTPEDRAITAHLYGGGGDMRIKQELVLGIGGIRMLRALGYGDIGTYHMNEGHAAFLTLELLRERNWKNEDVKKSCAFTTHTPVAAGHDVFDYDLAYRICGDNLPWLIREIAGQDRLSMTLLALTMSRYICGVSKVHGEVSRKMFPGYPIDAITNGIHHPTWVAPAMRKIFDRYVPGWEDAPEELTNHCRDIPQEELWEAHMTAKKMLIAKVNEQSTLPFDPEILTIAGARRVVSYKRPELLYTNLERLSQVCKGRVQIIHAGNAHPDDHFAQEVIQRMIERSSQLKDAVRIVYLPNYNTELAKLLVAGADVWLNTPMRLHEASGTSGMKAALNGTLNLSTLDGWWIEGYGMDPEAGWRIGPLANAVGINEHMKLDAEDIYTQLQYEVIPEYYYKDHKRWIRRMQRAIGLAGYFNTHRAVREYLEKAWNS